MVSHTTSDGHPPSPPRSQPPLPVSVTGKRVRLRPVMKDDLPHFYAWRCDLSTLPLWTPNRRIVTFDEFTVDFDQLLRDSIIMVVTRLNPANPSASCERTTSTSPKVGYGYRPT